MTSLQKSIAGAIFFSLALGLDRWSKLSVLALNLNPGEGFDFVPFLGILYTHNYGVTFGMAQGASVWGLAAIAIIISLGLLFWMHRAQSLIGALAMGGIAGGALGNAYDRVHYGSVVDFIHFHLGTWEVYPWIFNVGDSFIVCGVIALLLESWLLKRIRPAARKQP